MSTIVYTGGGGGGTTGGGGGDAFGGGGTPAAPQHLTKKSQRDYDRWLEQVTREYNNWQNEITLITNRVAQENKQDSFALLQDERVDEWNFDFTFRYFYKDQGVNLHRNYNNIKPSVYLQHYIEGENLDYMAGGYLYNAQLAGNIFFNPTGDLNTVTFLGLQSKNNIINISRMAQTSAQLFKMLDITAGKDDKHSEAGALQKLALSRINDIVVLPEQPDIPPAPKLYYDNNEIDTWVEFRDNVWKTIRPGVQDLNNIRHVGDVVSDVGGGISDWGRDVFGW